MKEYNMFLGMDIGDKFNTCCLLDSEGEIIRKFRVPCRTARLASLFDELTPCVIAIEACTHSPWISRLAEAAGHKVLVGNPRKLRAIYDTPYKDDGRDAELLARLARFEPRLLHPIHHRGEQAQADLMMLKARQVMVSNRTKLINSVRGLLKSFDVRVATCSAACFHKKARLVIPEILKEAIFPLLDAIEAHTTAVCDYDVRIAQISKERYDTETELLRSVSGVGPLTSLCFVLTLEEPNRIKHSRDVGAFLGLVPRRDQSGEIDKQLRITKAGNKYLRELLVSASHYILGPHGPDTALRRWGLKLTERGGKNAKKRAVVAVARKLAVLLHRLWVTGEVYVAFPQTDRFMEVA
jgi:transposase